MPPPLAHFLTWTCYGTWLHGDQRGSVDEQHASPGTPFLSPDPERVQEAKWQMSGRTVAFDDAARRIVHRVIEEHARFRGWHIHAMNVRTNHVHVVVSCANDISPERAMSEFKAWATRRLREAGMFSPGRRIWTHHGSTRWINHVTGIEAAIAYVLEGR